jgi:hypothetical protein
MFRTAIHIPQGPSIRDVLLRDNEAAMRNSTVNMQSSSSRVWHPLVQLAGIVLLILLAAAYVTGEEYAHTYEMIGYALALVLAINLFWLMVGPQSMRSSQVYSPRAVADLFKNPDGLTRTIAYLIAILATLPLFALFITLLTHTIWGATWIDEMHEVIAYFLFGLVLAYVVMVLIASSGYIEDRLRKLFN